MYIYKTLVSLWFEKYVDYSSIVFIQGSINTDKSIHIFETEGIKIVWSFENVYKFMQLTVLADFFQIEIKSNVIEEVPTDENN